MGVASRLRPSRYWLLPPALALSAGVALFAWPRPAEVAALPLPPAPVVDEASGTGTLESEAQVSVAFTIPGRIAKIEVQEGEKIKAGQVLSVLDPQEQDRHLTTARRGVDLAASAALRAEAEVTRARVTRDGAIRERKRAEALFAAGAVSEAERDLAVERADRTEAELSAAIAAARQGSGAVAVARASVAVEAHRSSETSVTSPFDGVVVRRVHEPGDVVSPGAPVLVIASTRKIWARTWLDETVIQKLREGQSARVSLRGSPEKSLPARVDRVAVEADRQTHEVLVDLELLALPDRLVLGQRADGFVTLTTASAP